jgi:hypothetical protein
MTGHGMSNGFTQEPGAAARTFVYGFAFGAPVLVFGAWLVPAAVHARFDGGAGGVALAAAAGVAYAAALFIGYRRVRSLSQRFTPPLPLPGDFWNRGAPAGPRRSSNWPLRLRPRRPDDGRRQAA